MIAGKMKTRLTLLQPTRVTDSFGAESVSYTATASIYAQRVKATGSRSEEVGEHFPAYEVEYNIRDAHTVAENWRVNERNGYLYTVVAIIPNTDRGYNTLICERVNE